ncbi:hypothetical protein GH714_009917 [Hevea brasiliensis]|uniref:Uncharacterized protein n=1 Tax=Hevea brasiliensis TaxID=3981 RepID=A0A6A6MIY8_HEVBR|nr:hypothetical protein GH714_009917 [Hevea brasiliensis]
MTNGNIYARCAEQSFSWVKLWSLKQMLESKWFVDVVRFIIKMEGKVVKIRQVAFAANLNILGNVILSRDIVNFEHESAEGEICKPLWEMMEDIIRAGTDSSSSTIEWMMVELIKNPKYLKKVQEEIESETNQDTIKESHLPHLTFLQACFKETLRLHPPAPLLISHRAVETCQVMNYMIPKNAEMLVNFWAIGRDPKIWEDLLVFKAEWFLNSSLDFKGMILNIHLSVLEGESIVAY